MYHGKDLIADGDTLDYTCDPTSVTKSGAGHYLELCNAESNNPTMMLDKCSPVIVAKPVFEVYVVAIKISWSHPAYPEATPERYEVILTNGNNSETRSAAGTSLTFDGLSEGTRYDIVLKAYWSDYGMYQSDLYTFITSFAVVPAQLTAQVNKEN